MTLLSAVGDNDPSNPSNPGWVPHGQRIPVRISSKGLQKRPVHRACSRPSFGDVPKHQIQFDGTNLDLQPHPSSGHRERRQLDVRETSTPRTRADLAPVPHERARAWFWAMVPSTLHEARYHALPQPPPICAKEVDVNGHGRSA